jgi:hypothetical protein
MSRSAERRMSKSHWSIPVAVVTVVTTVIG